ncbi:MAG: aconitate hydratase AcnA [Actinobacteria bacterium]|nr:aconitate hydratase AcnA [Actinomycetota bacterium]
MSKYPRTVERISKDGENFDFFSIRDLPGVDRLPFSLKVLLENVVRNWDGVNVTDDHIAAVLDWRPEAQAEKEIPFKPARVLMQDFTGVPAAVDLAAMRDAIKAMGADPRKINPLAPGELVIDHSLIVEAFGTDRAFEINVDREYEQNRERYQLLRWAQEELAEFKVVPPGTGICHQVNIEYLSRVVMLRNGVAYPDTVVGTDSHTTMVNGLGVVGWGVGGIEAEAALLGQEVSMLVPEVVGFKLSGELTPGTTATDLVLTVTEMLRKHGVVGKFVEFYGQGCESVSLATRATLGNMSPEYGSTIAIFPIDQITLDYLTLTGRSPEHVALVGEYAKRQGLWLDPNATPEFSAKLELDLAQVEPSLAGPRRPQDRISLRRAQEAFREILPSFTKDPSTKTLIDVSGQECEIGHGSVVIAAITSCTNTSNPTVMVAAGLLAKNAFEAGLERKPWVKTSLAPGSQVVTDYLDKAGLTPYLDKLGFDLVGYGCTTCIGNSGPLLDSVSAAVNEHDLSVAAVLSGNRNFEGRINHDVKMNYLASPPLVVVYALAGTMNIDLYNEPLGHTPDGKPIYMKDIWPHPKDVEQAIAESLDAAMFKQRYATVYQGDSRWENLETPTGTTFSWQPDSTYIRKPPFFENFSATPSPVKDIDNARVLVWLGDSVTTDHISPAGAIRPETPAAYYLSDHGVARRDFHSYGARRGNHEVMVRGTFANIRLKNKLVEGVEGGYTMNLLTGERSTIFDASVAYQSAGVPLVVLAGKEYGSGSSRDWAAKGSALLGIKAVIAESFERIHRSNLVGMGVAPLQFLPGESPETWGLTGSESLSVKGLEQIQNGPVPKRVKVISVDQAGASREFEVLVRIDTPAEADYYRNGGILPFVLRNLLNE